MIGTLHLAKSNLQKSNPSNPLSNGTCKQDTTVRETTHPPETKVTQNSNPIAKFGRISADSGKCPIARKASIHAGFETAEDSGRFGQKCPGKIRKPTFYPLNYGDC
jgi:hypothetical protein